MFDLAHQKFKYNNENVTTVSSFILVISYIYLTHAIEAVNRRTPKKIIIYCLSKESITFKSNKHVE